MPSDLRTFLRDAEAAGKLHRVSKEVDPQKNLAALCDEADHAIRFDNVAGYPGWTVVANLANDRDMEAVAYECDKDEVVRHVAAAYDRGPHPHVVVDDAPCQEVVWEGDEADLLRLPVAIHSELDGGPYFGGAMGIVHDPDTGIHNTTFPRVMVSDGKEVPFFIYSPHVSQIFAKYMQRNQPMPMAMVIGHHPAWEHATASSLHHPNCGELDYVGSLLGEEVEFVRCRTIPVDVPTHAEIVVEGEVMPGVMRPEGPFGNYLGTYANGPMAKAGVMKAPVFRVKAITTRTDPIYRHLQGTVWTDHQRLVALPIEANLWTALTELGIQIHDVYIPPFGGASMTILQMTPTMEGDARDALVKTAMWDNTTIGFMSQVVIAVNRDVNIYDARDLIWALAVRTHWARDVVSIDRTRCSPLMPVAEKVPGSFFRLGSKGLVDATHLPPRDESEAWEYHRVWPMGHGTVRLEDFVDDYRPRPLRQVRILGPEHNLQPGNAQEG